MESWEQIAVLFQDLAAGEEGAWQRLLVTLTPKLEILSRNQPIGRLRDDEDARRDIVAKVITRLHANEHRAIKRWVADDAPAPVRAWIRVVVRSAAIDVMRARPEYIRGSKNRSPGWFSLATLASQAGAAVPDSLVGKQREVESFMAESAREVRRAVEAQGSDAAGHLAATWQIPVVHTRRFVKRLDSYSEVLRMILAGCSYSEVSESLALSRREVELVVGYIEEFFHARGFGA
ncbi:MAG: hypothetical protein JKY56_18175 [Kofleriaceae bacterium]|nr:hypothetical protein [Kofleriaceae bacterium]